MIDLIIIGAGPIGLACGISAQEKGLNYLVLEKGTLVNSLFKYPLNMSFFSTSDRLEIGNIPFISQQPKPTRAEALEYYRRVASSKNLNISLYEEINSVEKSINGFKIITSKSEYLTKSLIVATGFYDFPYLLNIDGENLKKVRHYYSEPHPYFGMNLAIIGSANSAVDAALETYRKGAKSVTMIIREKEIGENVKYWARPDIINRIKEGSIKAYFNSSVTKITEQTISIKSPEKEFSIANDFVLAMTGYQPNFKLLEDLGVDFKSDKYKTPIYNEATMESNVPGVYLAGVVCGGLKTNKWFIENSREHAPKIINSISAG
jgi:putative YpdA family bacillithiol system oxidoreductase